MTDEEIKKETMVLDDRELKPLTEKELLYGKPKDNLDRKNNA